MKLFEQKKKPSLKEKVLIAERREMNALASSRFEQEKKLGDFLKDAKTTIEATNQSVMEAENLAASVIQKLNAEVSKLEAKKLELETSADEKLFRERRANFYKLEEEVTAKRDSLNARLADTEQAKQSLAFILQEHAEAEDALAKDKETFKALVSSEKIKYEEALQALDVRIKAQEAREVGWDQRVAKIEALQSAVEAQKQANTIFHQTLEKEREALGRDRKALKDAYAELAKSQERILGKQS